MSPRETPFSHPEANVRHSYPLVTTEAGFAKAVSLVARTWPYAVARFGILVAFTLGTVLWFAATIGLATLLAGVIHPWVGVGTFVLGVGAYGWVWFIVLRYGLYLLQAGHVAVLTELLTRGELGNGNEGLFPYGKRIVTERFGQVNVLFALDLLVRGVVGAFNRTLDFVTGFLPIPGLKQLMGIVGAILRMATTYIDETVFSYNLARGDTNSWRSSKDALIYYAQNSKEILKTAVGAVIADFVLTVIVWAVMLAPAFLLLAVLPESSKGLGFVGGVAIAALLASNVRQAFLKPVFLVMIMTRFHVLAHDQPINLEWDQRLSSVSRKFGEIKEKAAAEPTPEPRPAGQLPAGSV
jgi:Co/Zn/Cd efflux system component